MPDRHDKEVLLASIANSGGAVPDEGDLNGLLAKLAVLHETGRYQRLLNNLAASTDKSNFLAGIFEASFAHQCEAAGIALEYEVKQDEDQNSSVDFLWRMPDGRCIYLETRLLQQDATTAAKIKMQLEATDESGVPRYAVGMDNAAQRAQIIRLQQVILEKVQKANGAPTKFFSTEANVTNLVVVAVSDIVLGMVDIFDCALATYGDPGVPAEYRCGMVGLFQNDDPEAGWPAWVKDRIEAFAHIRSTLHGVVFAFRRSDASVLDYGLDQYLICNHGLLKQEQARALQTELHRALPRRVHS